MSDTSDECDAEVHCYEQRLTKLASSLGYIDEYGYPIADMFQEIERLRQDVHFLLELLDDKGVDKFRRFQEGRDFE